MAGGDFELEIVELERGRGDVDAEECGRIPVKDPDRRVQRQHVCWNPRLVVPRLHVEVLEHNILPIQHQISQGKKRKGHFLDLFHII